MNFAYFLAENRVYTAVLEGLSNQPVLKNWLKKYTSVPTSWKSYCRGRDTRNMYFMKSNLAYHLTFPDFLSKFF